MALLLMESFDHLSAASYTSGKGWVRGGGRPISVQSGRLGGQCIRTEAAQTDGATLAKNFTASSEVIAGFGFRLSTTQFSNPRIFTLYSGATLVLWMRIIVSGVTPVLQFINAAGSGVGLGTTPILVGSWNYIEIRCKVGNPTGELEVRLNGSTTPEINATGLNMGAVNINAISLEAQQTSSFGQGYNTDWDDLYVLDTTGSAPNNTFLGDCRVETIMPSGNGASSDFVGNDSNSTDNYLLVDDPGAPDTSTYVQSLTNGAKDLYEFGNISTTNGLVYGVQINPRAVKTSAGVRNFSSIARTGAGVEEDSAASALSTSYVSYTDLRPEKPGGGSWTVAEVNSAQFGIKVQP